MNGYGLAGIFKLYLDNAILGVLGLLGMVIGILITFNDMGQAGKIDANEIMLGLAMALKATAAGLVVAIPAIIFYNGLSRNLLRLLRLCRNLSLNL